MSDALPWLVVGLGNPGPRYAGNRHNVGFRAVDALVERQSANLNAPSWKERWKSLSTLVELAGQRCVVLKPQTFMNRSGEAVNAAASFYQVPTDRTIVAHDEIDFDFGRMAIKRDGGHGGHNGLRDIIQALGSRDFLRVRIGVGRPQHGEVHDWVLSDFTGPDAGFVPDLVRRAADAVQRIVSHGVTRAMEEFNVTSPSIEP